VPRCKVKRMEEADSTPGETTRELKGLHKIELRVRTSIRFLIVVYGCMCLPQSCCTTKRSARHRVFRQKLKKQTTQIYMDLSHIDPQARVLNYFYE